MKLIVLTPMCRDPKVRFRQSLDQIRNYIHAKGVNGTPVERLEFMEHAQCSLLPMGRQVLLNAAIASDSTHALFIDDDMRFDADILDSMYRGMVMQHPLDENNKPIIVGMVATNYLVKGIPTSNAGCADGMMFTAATCDDFVMSSYKKAGYEITPKCALGFALIDLNVMRTAHVLSGPYAPAPLISPPHFEVLWNPAKNAYTGEDVYFVQKLKAAGITTYIDHNASQKIGHIGDFEYNLHVMKPN